LRDSGKMVEKVHSIKLPLLREKEVRKRGPNVRKIVVGKKGENWKKKRERSGIVVNQDGCQKTTSLMKGGKGQLDSFNQSATGGRRGDNRVREKNER